MTNKMMDRIASALWEEFADCPKPEIVGNLVVLTLPDGPLSLLVKRPGVKQVEVDGVE